MYLFERFECGVREYFEQRDHGGQEFVLLFDHNKRAFIGYDADEEDFLLNPEEWLDKPIDETMSKGAAMMVCLKSREALETGRIIEYSDVAVPMGLGLARYFNVRVIPDGPGLCLFHFNVLATFSLN